MYNCLLLPLTIFNKEIKHNLVSAYIKWKLNIFYAISKYRQLISTGRSNKNSYEYSGTLVFEELTHHLAMFCVIVNVYVSYLARKKKCTSQPLVNIV